jgi:hypothetical protein
LLHLDQRRARVFCVLQTFPCDDGRSCLHDTRSQPCSFETRLIARTRPHPPILSSPCPRSLSDSLLCGWQSHLRVASVCLSTTMRIVPTNPFPKRLPDCQIELLQRAARVAQSL